MRRRPSSALVLVGALVAMGAACSESTAPAGKGNDVVVDVDGSGGPPEQPGDDAPDDSPFARVDSGYQPPPDGYSPFAFCSSCSCPAGTYCFGGGTSFESFNGDCHEDAGADAGLAIGCQPFPPACAAQPTCECLIQALAPSMPCYPVCSITTLIVYCPNP
jgi:hypothetical protein